MRSRAVAIRANVAKEGQDLPWRASPAAQDRATTHVAPRHLIEGVGLRLR